MGSNPIPGAIILYHLRTFYIPMRDLNTMAFDVESVRRDFPALADWVYLDTAFVGLMPRQVREGYDEWADEWYRLSLEPGETILGRWMKRTGKVRGMLASLVGARPEEIALTTCTGSGLNIVINGTQWERGDNVVFPELEHNPAVTYTTKRIGVEPRTLQPVKGRFELSDLEKAVDDRTKLVQVSQVSYVNGFRFDLKEVADIAHEHGAKALVDATQAVGALEVDYQRDGVDYVSVAPYKYLMGPAGLAFLYVSEENLSTLIPDRVGWKNQVWEGNNPEEVEAGETAAKFEYGTIHFQGVYAIEKSLEYIDRVGIKAIESQVLSLRDHLFARLTDAGKEMYTPEDVESPIVSFMQEDAVGLAKKLMSKRIKVTGRRVHRDHIRASLHFYNTEGDIDRLIENLSRGQ